MTKTLSADAQIQERIEAFTIELSALVRQAAMDSIKQALGGSATSAASSLRSSTRTVKHVKRGTRIRRTPEDLEALSDKLIGYVGTNPGSRLEEISRGTGIDSSELKKPVADLLAARQLTKEGQKRGTTYWVVTK